MILLGVVSLLISFVLLVVTINPNWFLKKFISPERRVKRRYTLLASVACFILFFVAAVNTDMETVEVSEITEDVETNEASAKDIPQAAEDKEEAAPDDLEAYIPWIINNVAGESSNIKNEKRLRNVEYDENGITIELMADDNLTVNMIKTGILSKSTEIYEQVFSDRTDVQKVYLNWDLPMQDVKGNESMVPVIIISLSAENAKTFNWDNFMYSNLPEATDSYTEHRMFRE